MMKKMIFPENATDLERNADWQKITEITDADFEFTKLEDFIAEQQSNEGKIENYSGCFSNRHDLEIAKYFKSMEGQK